MLTTNMNETGTNSAKVEEPENVIYEMLQFIYCGSVESFDDGLVNDLIYAAEKYNLVELKEDCIDELAKNVFEDDVIDTLIIADRISGTEKLVIACIPIVTR
jgi:hypothetical protein